MSADDSGILVLPTDTDPVVRRWLINLLQRGERSSSKPGDVAAMNRLNLDAPEAGTLARSKRRQRELAACDRDLDKALGPA
jgi:hypothetical protein